MTRRTGRRKKRSERHSAYAGGAWERGVAAAVAAAAAARDSGCEVMVVVDHVMGFVQSTCVTPCCVLLCVYYESARPLWAGGTAC